jgi:membrane fusion protein, multidrug efflux system
MKKKTIIIAAAIAVLALISIKLVANKTTINEKNQLKAGVVTTITIKEVVRKEQSSSLSLTGVTAAKQDVLLKAETGGQVAAINFNLGDYVAKGKVLVEIDDRLTKLAFESAQLNLSKLEDEYNKMKNLYSGQATSETKVRDARIEYERAKIAAEQAEKQLSFTKITATQNGYAVSKFVDKGSFVGIGSPIVSLVDIAQLKVTMSVSEKDAYNLNVGQNVKVTSSVYPGVEYDGKVSFVSEQGDGIHNYPVEILVANKSAHQLKAGTFVNAAFIFSAKTSSLLIPRESLVGSIKDAKVYVVEQNTARQKSITIGRDLNNYLEVLAGLNEGDKVVTTGQINLTDGAPVSIFNN